MVSLPSLNRTPSRWNKNAVEVILKETHADIREDRF